MKLGQLDGGSGDSLIGRLDVKDVVVPRREGCDHLAVGERCRIVEVPLWRLVEEKGEFTWSTRRDDVSEFVARIQCRGCQKRKPRRSLRAQTRIGEEEIVVQTREVGQITEVCDARTLLFTSPQEFKKNLSLGTAFA